MGRPIGTQKRGKGSHRYRRPSHRYKTEAHYRPNNGGILKGVITGFDHDPSKTAILMKVKWQDGNESLYLAPEGVFVNDMIEQGAGASLSIGNVLPLSEIPEGMPVFNIEKVPGDGGTIVRASGTAAFVIAKKGDKVIVRLPSKRMKPLDGKCRAMIGIVAGGGRTEEPFVKAGNKYHRERAKGKRYPIVRGVAMNPVAHPHGGSQHHTGKATTVKRQTPPGRKVGHIAARRTGRRKRK
ncbi:MAG: 50S ribosomal protein L2 [Candidatus Diapherotrites archaeon]|nr:50S ribosomal protein L2 [Candidatus Diapherotrites archaeon]